MPQYLDVKAVEVFNSAGQSVANTVVTIERTQGGRITPTVRINRADTAAIVRYQGAQLSNTVISPNVKPSIQTIDIKYKVIENNSVSNSAGRIGRDIRLNGPPFAAYVETAVQEYQRAVELEKRMESNPGLGTGRWTKREREKQDYRDNWRRVVDFLNPFDNPPSERIPREDREPEPVRPRNPFPSTRIPWNQPGNKPVKRDRPWEDEKPVNDAPPQVNTQPDTGTNLGPVVGPVDTTQPVKDYLRFYGDCIVQVTFVTEYQAGGNWVFPNLETVGATEWNFSPPNFAPYQTTPTTRTYINTSTGNPIAGTGLGPFQFTEEFFPYQSFAAPARDNDMSLSVRGILVRGTGNQLADRFDSYAAIRLRGPIVTGEDTDFSPGVFYYFTLIENCSYPVVLPEVRVTPFEIERGEDMSCLALQLQPILERIEGYLAIVADGSIASVCSPTDTDEAYPVEGKGLYGIASMLQGIANQNVEIGYHVCDEVQTETEVVSLLSNAVNSNSIALPSGTLAVRGTVVSNGASYKRFSREDGVSHKYSLGFYSWETATGDRLPEQPIEWERCIFPTPNGVAIARFYYWLPTATSFNFEVIKEIENGANNT